MNLKENSSTAEFETTEKLLASEKSELEKIRTQKAQFEHRIQEEKQKIKRLKRRTRTHRLIERGAMLESFLDNPEELSNEEIMGILRMAFENFH